jgi:hypothetical protein
MESKQLYDKLEAQYIHPKEMTTENTIRLLERAIDMSLYLQIPSIKPEMPRGNADVLRGSIWLEKHLKKSSNSHILKCYPQIHLPQRLVSLHPSSLSHVLLTNIRLKSSEESS